MKRHLDPPAFSCVLTNQWRWHTRLAASRPALLSCLLLTFAQAAATAGIAQQYLPLHVGNSWSYIGDDQSTRQFSVIGTREIEGHGYFLLDDWYSPCCLPGDNDNIDILFRYDAEADRVLQRDPANQQDVVRYDFSGKPWGDCGHQLTDTGLSVTVPAGQFDEAVRFSYATLVDCGSFHETLAPDVGTAAFFSSWEGNFQLQNYTIVPEPFHSARCVLLATALLMARARRP